MDSWVLGIDCEERRKFLAISIEYECCKNFDRDIEIQEEQDMKVIVEFVFA